jgi:hypothetical protein
VRKSSASAVARGKRWMKLVVDEARSRTTGVVVGSRKAGTTWLYENFKLDPGVCVATDVKESRYFLGSMDEGEYDKLFACKARGHRLEVDTALFHEPSAAGRIAAYSSDMRVLVIVREPVSFAVSRYIHSRRKGELEDLPLGAALDRNRDIAAEFSYRTNVERFRNAGLDTVVIAFEDLTVDQDRFYARARAALTGEMSAAAPQIRTAVNQARTSSAPALTALLATVAKSARAAGMHRMVNRAKGLGLHQRVEQGVAGTDVVNDLTEQAGAWVAANAQDAVAFHASVRAGDFR